MRQFKFVLLENAIDSLQQGIGFALMENPTRSDLKLSILLIAQAVELLLKERLRREHWSLIFTDVERAGNPNARTVTIDESLKRLEHIAKVRFEKKEEETIRNISNIRNQIQHYEIEVTFEDVIGKAHAVIPLITRFLKDEFDSDIRNHLKERDAEKLLYIDEVLEHLQELARQKIEKIRKTNMPSNTSEQINWQFDVLNCAQCWQNYYVFSPDSNVSQCQLCNYEAGFAKCSQCGVQAPRVYWGLHSDDEGNPICDNCALDLEIDIEYE